MICINFQIPQNTQSYQDRNGTYVPVIIYDVVDHGITKESITARAVTLADGRLFAEPYYRRRKGFAYIAKYACPDRPPVFYFGSTPGAAVSASRVACFRSKA